MEVKFDDFAKQFIRILCLKPKKYRNLHKSIYSFLANALQTPNIRTQALHTKILMNALAFKLREIDTTDLQDTRWINSAENLLGTFINLSFNHRIEFQEEMNRLGLNRYFIQLADL